MLRGFLLVAAEELEEAWSRLFIVLSLVLAEGVAARRGLLGAAVAERPGRLAHFLLVSGLLCFAHHGSLIVICNRLRRHVVAEPRVRIEAVTDQCVAGTRIQRLLGLGSSHISSLKVVGHAIPAAARHRMRHAGS